MESVIIKSANTSAALTFCEKEGDYFQVIFDGPAVKLSKKVWGYTDCELLVDLFEYMAKEWKGWSGAQEWSSIEGEFWISATCDSLGHIMLSLSLKEFDGPEPWESIAKLGIDSGQLDSTAKKVREFFGN
jgi:hypothetical protein